VTNPYLMSVFVVLSCSGYSLVSALIFIFSLFVIVPKKPHWGGYSSFKLLSPAARNNRNKNRNDFRDYM